MALKAGVGSVMPVGLVWPLWALVSTDPDVPDFRADEHPVFGGVQDGGDDADDLALIGHERSPGAAGVGRRIELDQVRQHALALG